MRVDAKLWRAAFERDGGICQFCGVDLLASFSAYWSATVDHQLAVAAGGADDIGNLKLACPACNGILSRSGHRKTYDERRAYVQQRMTEERAGYEEWIASLRGKK